MVQTDKSTQTLSFQTSPNASLPYSLSTSEVRHQRSYSADARDLYGARTGAAFGALFIPEAQHEDSLPLTTASGELPDVSLTYPPSQGSFVTIFSLWSTLVGTSALTMPWAVAQEICNQILGSKIAFFSLCVSLINLLGDLICYWLMLSSFLFEIGLFGSVASQDLPYVENATKVSPVDSGQNEVGKFWNESFSVPLYLVLLMLPVMSLRYPTFFTKCSSLGSVSVIFLIVFATVKSVVIGINTEPEIAADFTLASSRVPATCGVLFFGFLIHNVIISMTAYHSKPHKRVRDTGIAVALAALTYAFLGVSFYLVHPGPKQTISDNFLKDFAHSDVLAFVARILLFFQMITMFPLLAFVFRAQLFYGWARRIDLGMHYIILLNLALLGVCMAFASLYPRIGHILRFGGAVCGLIYICILPGVMDAVIAYRCGQRLVWKVIVICFYGLLGLANLIAQFFILF